MYSSTPALLSFAAVAAAVAVPQQPIAARAPSCGRYDVIHKGHYYVANNQWGLDYDPTGKQCISVQSWDCKTLAWKADFNWGGKEYEVKTFVNADVNTTGTRLKDITSMPITFQWDIQNTSVVTGNVAVDMFVSDTANGAVKKYEIMTWIHSMHGMFPLTDPNAGHTPYATPTVGDRRWNLFRGVNGDMIVFSFVSPEPIPAFRGDMKLFIAELVANHNVDADLFLTNAGGGAEITKGDGTFTVSAYSLEVKTGAAATTSEPSGESPESVPSGL